MSVPFGGVRWPEVAPLGVSGSWVCSVGSRCSGGSMDGWPNEETLVREAFKVGEPVRGESAIDRARSVPSGYQHLSGRGVCATRASSTQRRPGRGGNIPARRACLCFRPSRISSSSFFVRSSSSLSRRSPSSRMRSRKSFTSSDPSGCVGAVMVPVARRRRGTASFYGKWWHRMEKRKWCCWRRRSGRAEDESRAEVVLRPA